MKRKRPLASCVIRTKNEEKWLGKVLQSLMEQTFKDFEIIIVDSGSTDKTLEIIKKLPVKLIEIKQEDYNPSYSLNLGISKSKGDLIVIISAHTIPISKTWLEDGLINFKDKKVAGITGHCMTFPIGYYSEKLGNLYYGLLSKEKRHHYRHFNNTNSIIRKDLWEKYPFDEKLDHAEDYDWGLEMLTRGHDIIKDPKFSAHHSHFLLNKPSYIRRYLFWWRKIGPVITGRKRPRKSYTRIKAR